MNKSTIYAIVAVLIIVIVVGAVAAYVLSTNSGGTTSPTATPTPTPEPASAVASATNITFSAAVTSQGTTTTYNWTGKNIHANNPLVRVDFANYAYIMDAGQQQSWISTDSGATWTVGNFTADWISWSPQWTDYLNNLTHWSGSGDYSYTNAVGEAITISNVAIDQAIPDSVFSTS